MNGRDNYGFADNIKLLRRDLAELKEMVRLGARIPGDEQRIEAIKGLLARWQMFASVTILDAVAPRVPHRSRRGRRGARDAQAGDVTTVELVKTGSTEVHGSAAIITSKLKVRLGDGCLEFRKS